LGKISSFLRSASNVFEILMEFIDDKATTFKVKVQNDVMGGLVKEIVVD
jgi:hypothetical protein